MNKDDDKKTVKLNQIYSVLNFFLTNFSFFWGFSKLLQTLLEK